MAPDELRQAGWEDCRRDLKIPEDDPAYVEGPPSENEIPTFPPIEPPGQQTLGSDGFVADESPVATDTKDKVLNSLENVLPGVAVAGGALWGARSFLGGISNEVSFSQNVHNGILQLADAELLSLHQLNNNR